MSFNPFSKDGAFVEAKDLNNNNNELVIMLWIIEQNASYLIFFLWNVSLNRNEKSIFYNASHNLPRLLIKC